jgi:hypothetical protein
MKRRRRRSEVIVVDAWEQRRVGEYRVAMQEFVESLLMWPFNGRAFVAGLVTASQMILRVLVNVFRQ